MDAAMTYQSRRTFIASAAIATAAAPGLFKAAFGAAASRTRVFVASNGADGNGILAYDWDTEKGELAPAGVGAALATVDWLTFSHAHDYVYAACEIRSFQGKPTGEVASYRLQEGKLTQLSARNAASVGTCHIAVDHTGGMAISADYGGGSAASYKITDGVLSEAAWTEHYTGHGPVVGHQETAHAHFTSFSPDNRFAYINDLGADCIHIYKPDPATANMTPAGTYHAAVGSGPRTLHFHPNGKTAYCMNELASTVDVLTWNKADGSLTLVNRIALLPDSYKGPTSACDTVISRDGRFVYFANRGDSSIYAFHADPKTGSLTRLGQYNCGGKTPRNFVLDPTEKWMLVANQDSGWISVFARNPETGLVAAEGKNFPAAKPMCILFA